MEANGGLEKTVKIVSSVASKYVFLSILWTKFLLKNTFKNDCKKCAVAPPGRVPSLALPCYATGGKSFVSDLVTPELNSRSATRLLRNCQVNELLGHRGSKDIETIECEHMSVGSGGQGPPRFSNMAHI